MAIVVPCAAVAMGLVVSSSRARPASTGPVASVANIDESRVRDLDIEFYARRSQEDPRSAGDRSRLAGLYLQRARETGSFNDYSRAESVAVAALALREAHNDETFTILAAARLARHDFTGALSVARKLVARDPQERRSQALLGEILLELGRYDEAATIFRPLELETNRLSIVARLVRWYELTGRLDHARHVAEYALNRAVTEQSLTREQEAWFHLRLGELELRRGGIERAESLFTKGLEAFPQDYRLLAAKARAAAMRGDARAAIEAGERAIAIQLDPATLGVLSDAWATLGDSSQAASYARAMRASALTQPGPIHRAWGLFLIDHGAGAADVLARARRELTTRHDVYGYDLAAWALHALRRDREAWTLMQKALAQGTEDAMLWHHAAKIAKGIGEDETAAELETKVRSLNPRFRTPGSVVLTAGH